MRQSRIVLARLGEVTRGQAGLGSHGLFGSVYAWNGLGRLSWIVQFRQVSAVELSNGVAVRGEARPGQAVSEGNVRLRRCLVRMCGAWQ